MKERQEEILHLLTENQQGLTASNVAERLNIDRSNASRYLSELYKAHHIVKTAGRPVVYSLPTEKSKSDEVHVDSSTQVTFETLVGENDSLKVSIQQAKSSDSLSAAGATYHYFWRNWYREVDVCGMYVSFCNRI